MCSSGGDFGVCRHVMVGASTQQQGVQDAIEWGDPKDLVSHTFD